MESAELCTCEAKEARSGRISQGRKQLSGEHVGRGSVDLSTLKANGADIRKEDDKFKQEIENKGSH